MDSLPNDLVSALAPILLSLISTALGIVGTWALAKLAEIAGIRVEQARRDQLHNGITTAVNAILMPLVARGRMPTREEVAEAIRTAPAIVMNLNPDAAKYFKAGDAEIEKIAQAKAAELMAKWTVPAVAEVAK